MDANDATHEVPISHPTERVLINGLGYHMKRLMSQWGRDIRVH